LRLIGEKTIGLIFLVIILFSSFAVAFLPIPISKGAGIPTIVSINGRQLLVNGAPFMIKGVGYAPTPIGTDPEITPPYGDYLTANYNFIYERDLLLLRQMGANTIRLWGWNNTADHGDFLNKAYNNGVNPLYVIVTFWMGNSAYPDVSSIAARAKIKADFRNMVSSCKNNPAVLMWSIGNDPNALYNYGNHIDDFFSLVNEMAQEAHAEEGSTFHPVTTPLADVDFTNTVSKYNNVASSLDVWSIQAYRGNSFGSLFNDYTNVSAKPLAIMEFGIDAYDNNKGDEYEKNGTAYQAVYAEALYKEIAANKGTCIGGSIMAYSDEWWKGKYGTIPEYNPAYHSAAGFPTGAQPDGYANEEWWGIMRNRVNGSAPDIMEPRKVYSSLQSLWSLTGLAIPLSQTVTTGQNAAINISISGGIQPYTYQWYENTNLLAGQTSAQLLIAKNTLGKYNYSCRATDSAWTSSTSNNVTVTVTLPLTIVASPANSSATTGQTVNLTVNVTGGTTPYTFQWYEGSSIIASGPSQIAITKTTAGSFTFYCQVIDATGTMAYSNSMALTVTAPLAASASPSNITITADQLATFDATASGGTSPYSYQWYNSTNMLIGQTSAQMETNMTPGVYSFYCKITDSNGTTAKTNSVTLMVDIPPTPPPTPISSPAPTPTSTSTTTPIVTPIKTATPTQQPTPTNYPVTTPTPTASTNPTSQVTNPPPISTPTPSPSPAPTTNPTTATSGYTQASPIDNTELIKVVGAVLGVLAAAITLIAAIFKSRSDKESKRNSKANVAKNRSTK
jgi:hypothetical protein